MDKFQRVCRFWWKDGLCVEGATCKYQHPPRENPKEELVHQAGPDRASKAAENLQSRHPVPLNSGQEGNSRQAYEPKSSPVKPRVFAPNCSGAKRGRTGNNKGAQSSVNATGMQVSGEASGDEGRRNRARIEEAGPSQAGQKTTSLSAPLKKAKEVVQQLEAFAKEVKEGTEACTILFDQFKRHCEKREKAIVRREQAVMSTLKALVAELEEHCAQEDTRAAATAATAARDSFVRLGRGGGRGGGGTNNQQNMQQQQQQQQQQRRQLEQQLEQARQYAQEARQCAQETERSNAERAFQIEELRQQQEAIAREQAKLEESERRVTEVSRRLEAREKSLAACEAKLRARQLRIQQQQQQRLQQLRRQEEGGQVEGAGGSGGGEEAKGEEGGREKVGTAEEDVRMEDIEDANDDDDNDDDDMNERRGSRGNNIDGVDGVDGGGMRLEPRVGGEAAGAVPAMHGQLGTVKEEAMEEVRVGVGVGVGGGGEEVGGRGVTEGKADEGQRDGWGGVGSLTLAVVASSELQTMPDGGAQGGEGGGLGGHNHHPAHLARGGESARGSGSGSFIRGGARAMMRTAEEKRRDLEAALLRDAPELLQALHSQGLLEEMQLYPEGPLEGEGEEEEDPENRGQAGDSAAASFRSLRGVVTKIHWESSGLFRDCAKGGAAVSEKQQKYDVRVLVALVEQARHMEKKGLGFVLRYWCRQLQAFIFIFDWHNRIIVERPEYGYATYAFEVEEMGEGGHVDWQLKRLVAVMSAPHIGRLDIWNNKPLEDLKGMCESDHRLLESFGWQRGTGIGAFLNYSERIVHDRTADDEPNGWFKRVGKMLVDGRNGGRKTRLQNLGPAREREFQKTVSARERELRNMVPAKLPLLPAPGPPGPLTIVKDELIT